MPDVNVTLNLPTRMEIWSQVKALEVIHRDRGNTIAADLFAQQLTDWGWRCR